MVDGEMEGGDGVATCGIGIVVSGSRCALSVFCAVPDIAVAGGDCLDSGGTMIDGKV